MTRISLIAAMTKNRVIGRSGGMPWHLPADLIYFKKTTLGKPVIMGRKTFESIGRPLPKRRNIVISRQSLTLPGCEVFHSIEAAIDAVDGADEAMIIGGGHLYQQALPMAQRLYLTLIDVELEGDTFFPLWLPDQWQVVSKSQHAADHQNSYNYQFIVMDRKP
jgi:dihydrofolate reductase